MSAGGVTCCRLPAQRADGRQSALPLIPVCDPVSSVSKLVRVTVLVVLFGMLIVSFAFWGVGDMLRMGRGAVEVAHVGGTRIPLYGWVGGTSVSVEEVRDRFNRQLEAAQRQGGPRPDAEQAIRFGLHFRALEDAIQRALIDQAIRDLGLSVSDEQVRAAIALNPTFFGIGGQFDANVYRARLQNVRLSEAQYVADLRREIAASQLAGVIRTDGLAPAGLRETLFKLNAERRVAETIYVPDAIVTEIGKPTAEQLSTYFEANKARFEIPEYRAFSYVLLTVQDVIGQIEPTTEQIRQEYDARAAEFATPEKREADQVLLDTEDKAKAVVAAVRGGKSLEDAAKEALGNADGVISLGTVEKKDLPPGALADTVFDLAAGTVSEPVRTPLGWHVLRVVKIEAGNTIPLDEARARIIEDIKQQAAPDLLIRLVTDFERTLGKTQSIAAAAEDLKLKLHRVDGVDARGADAEGRQVVVGAAAAALVEAAFATRESMESAVLDTPQGEFLAVRTDRIVPARVPALSEIEARVVEAWQASERRAEVDKRVKAALDRVNGGGEFSAEARSFGLEMRTTRAVARNENDVGNYLTGGAVRELFALAPARATSVRASEGTVLVRVKEVQAADLTREAEAMQAFGRQLDSQFANDLVGQMLQSWRQRYGVTIDQAVFAAAFRPQQAPQER